MDAAKPNVPVHDVILLNQKLFYGPAGHAVETQFYQCLLLGFTLDAQRDRFHSQGVSLPAQIFQELLVRFILVNAVNETIGYFKIAQPGPGETLNAVEMTSEILDTNVTAQLPKNVAKIAEGFGFAKSAILRHFDPESATQFGMRAQQCVKLIAKTMIRDCFNR